MVLAGGLKFSIFSLEEVFRRNIIMKTRSNIGGENIEKKTSTNGFFSSATNCYS